MAVQETDGKQTAMRIDMNSDMGESFGRWTLGDDEALLDELAADSGVDQLATYGIDAKSFIAAYLDGFDYRIDEVKVDGDSATATVVLTCKKFDAFAQALTEATTALAEDGQTAELDADQINEKVGQLVLEALGSVEPTESTGDASRARTTHGGRRAEPSRRCLPRCSQARVRVICGGYV